jgi:hypothetical protein
MTGERFMHHDARGTRGPYTAVDTDTYGIWYCMVPEGVDVPPGSPVTQSGGMVGCSEFMREHGELLHRVGWASRHALFQGLRPGLHGPVGWERVTPTTPAA